MSKHLSKDALYKLPSGAQVHPCRLIIKDGTLMWKHAMLHNNRFTSLPITEAHEQHIIKTAQRLEELNVWVSQDLEPWESLMPIAWYDPEVEELNEGISVYLHHPVHSATHVYNILINHVQPHETIHLIDDQFPKADVLFFKRC